MEKKEETMHTEISDTQDGCELEMAVLLFISALKSLGTEDKLKFIVYARLISHLAVVCEDLI